MQFTPEADVFEHGVWINPAAAGCLSLYENT